MFKSGIPFGGIAVPLVSCTPAPIMSDPAHKAHRPSQAGKKAEKKDAAQGKDRSGGKGFNEKVSWFVLSLGILLTHS